MSVATERPDELIEILEGDLLARNDIINRWGNIISSFQNISGLVGFWPMSSVQRSTGNAYDLSGQGRTLTYNGNPTYNIYNSFAPYIDLDGTGDYLSRADETDLDITGAETIYNSSVRGLTMGCWGRTSDVTPVIAPTIINKYGAAGQRSYSIDFRIDSLARAKVSVDGTAFVSVIASATDAIINDTWFFVATRFIPSTELAVFVNNNKTTNTTSIPASIFSSTASFVIGAQSDLTKLFNGDISFSFLSANALPDATINALFQQSRSLFGV